MKYSYTTPDFNADITTLRAQVRRDYEEMRARFALGQEFDLEVALVAVKAGGTGEGSHSPYHQFRSKLLSDVNRKIKDDEKLNGVMEVITGVWNHFPHDDLDGLSPFEKTKQQYAVHGDDVQKQNIPPFFLGEDAYIEQVDKKVRSLSDAAKSNLLNYLEKVGCGKKDVEHIIGILADPKEEPQRALMYLLARMSEVARSGKKHLISDDMQPVVRAISSSENYTASKMPNGRYTSRMFQYLVEQAMEFNEAESGKTKHGSSTTILDPLAAFNTLSMVHDAISDFTHTLEVDIGIKEASIHIADWLAMLDIHELLKRENLNITALYIMAAARLIAATGDPRNQYKRIDDRLRNELARCKETIAYEKETRRIARKALQATADPIMMMPVPWKEPRNCMKNLALLEPSLALRSPYM